VATQILDPGVNCWRVERAERAAPLIDGAAYFDALRSALLKAERQIFVVSWDIDGRIALPRGDAEDNAPETLRDLIDYLARRHPHLKIYILLWDYSILYAGERQPLPRITIDWATPDNIRLVLDNKVPLGGSHHQKIVVVDDRLAFVGGMDLTRQRWDTPDHAADNPQRVDHDGKPYPPFHDVQLAVDGMAARALGDHCRWRWERSTGEMIEPVKETADAWPEDLIAVWRDVTVGIARTLPAGQGHTETREILQLYKDSIAAARRSIYIENQYLAAEPISEALASRLAEPDGPEVVIVTQWAASAWLEEQVMSVRRARCLARLRKADCHGRLRVLAPLVPGVPKNEYCLHAKIAVVDDRLVQIGSANLNNRSMGYDTECNLAIECHSEQERAAARSFRDKLLAEHLGKDLARLQAEIQRCGSLVSAIDSFGSQEGRGLAELNMPETPPERLEAIADLGDPEKPLMTHSWFEEALPQPIRMPGGSVKFRSKVLLAFIVVLVTLAAVWGLADLIYTFV
jgi:phosphatidylserine/phosphatidylglycerophosphate/cardiolipin synthase-like enzyme